MSELCEAEWDFDVYFWVSCELPKGHPGRHHAQTDGNGGVTASLNWGSEC